MGHEGVMLFSTNVLVGGVIKRPSNKKYIILHNKLVKINLQ